MDIYITKHEAVQITGKSLSTIRRFIDKAKDGDLGKNVIRQHQSTTGKQWLINEAMLLKFYGIPKNLNKNQDSTKKEQAQHAQTEPVNQTNTEELEVLTGQLSLKQREIGYLLNKIDEKDTNIEKLHLELREVSCELSVLKGVSKHARESGGHAYMRYLRWGGAAALLMLSIGLGTWVFQKTEINHFLENTVSELSAKNIAKDDNIQYFKGELQVQKDKAQNFKNRAIEKLFSTEKQIGRLEQEILDLKKENSRLLTTIPNKSSDITKIDKILDVASE